MLACNSAIGIGTEIDKDEQHHVPEAVPGIRALAHDVRLERYQRRLLLLDGGLGARTRVRLPWGGHAGRRVKCCERADVDEEEEGDDAHGRQGNKGPAPPRGCKREASRGWVSLDVVHFGGLVWGQDGRVSFIVYRSDVSKILGISGVGVSSYYGVPIAIEDIVGTKR
ncbi:hypothetical protein PspLS_04650 [Pyricularia sp. CBS 133598]|nr:hypothetical protein PspLS_04650 [Pyricularia sp. CBS 133598]